MTTVMLVRVSGCVSGNCPVLCVVGCISAGSEEQQRYVGREQVRTLTPVVGWDRRDPPLYSWSVKKPTCCWVKCQQNTREGNKYSYP